MEINDVILDFECNSVNDKDKTEAIRGVKRGLECDNPCSTRKSKKSKV